MIFRLIEPRFLTFAIFSTIAFTPLIFVEKPGHTQIGIGGSSGASVDYSQLVPKPSPINQGLTSPSPAYMKSVLGIPGQLTTDCSSVTNPKLRKLIVTESVGPFNVTGLKPAVATVRRVFAAVKRDNPILYSQLGSAGMLCVRKVRGGSDFSNHSWGTAIDITINNKLDTRGDDKTQVGLKELYPYFHKEGFYWGAGFPTEDSMHFEASKEQVAKWQTQSLLTAPGRETQSQGIEQLQSNEQPILIEGQSQPNE